MLNNIDRPENNNRHVIPQDESKCIWMTAGCISYKLCDLNFDCANCPLDKVMRSGRSDGKDLVASSPILRKEADTISYTDLLKGFPPFQLKTTPQYYYHSQYTWVEVIDSKTVRIGIDPFLLQLLGHVHVIVMPLPRIKLHQGEYFCWLFGDYQPLPLVSPINGTVEFINQSIREEPELMVTHEDKPVWLAQVTTTDFAADKKGLYHGASAQQWRTNQVDSLMKQFNTSLDESMTRIGDTMQDGGARLTHIADILGRKKYYDTIFKLLRHRIKK